MNILIVYNRIIPPKTYGGIERVIWSLGKELAHKGHRVFYLVKKGSACDFATIINIEEGKQLSSQVPDYIDIIHLNFSPAGEQYHKPYITTIHENIQEFFDMDLNAVFLSRSHAAQFGSSSYVYNGLDWNEYEKPLLDNPRQYFHFLGDASWRVKNVKGAIDVILKTKKEKLKVLGGHRLNFRMGFRFTLSSRISFEGMVGNSKKFQLLQNSKGLVFPVKWPEPFGLAITESLYMGCPVFGTPYGSLPELVNEEVGFLTNDSKLLAEAVECADTYDRHRCHEYAADVFNARTMAEAYLKKYEIVLSGKTLHQNHPRLVQKQTEKFLIWT